MMDTREILRVTLDQEGAMRRVDREAIQLAAIRQQAYRLDEEMLERLIEYCHKQLRKSEERTQGGIHIFECHIKAPNLDFRIECRRVTRGTFAVPPRA